MAVAGGSNGRDDDPAPDDWTWLGRIAREGIIRQWEEIAAEFDEAEAQDRVDAAERVGDISPIAGHETVTLYDVAQPVETWVSARRLLTSIDVEHPPTYDCAVCHCRVPHRDVAVGDDSTPRCPEHATTEVRQ